MKTLAKSLQIFSALCIYVCVLEALSLENTYPYVVRSHL